RSKVSSGMGALHRGARAAERTAAAHVRFEEVAEVLVETLHRLGRTGGMGAERVGTDGLVEVGDEIEVTRRGLAGFEALEQVHAEWQPLAARRAEAARLTREEALQVERDSHRAVIFG